MNSNYYRPGSLSAHVDSAIESDSEWAHDLYHSPFREHLIQLRGEDAYERIKKFRGCKDAKGGIEAARRWREMV